MSSWVNITDQSTNTNSIYSNVKPYSQQSQLGKDDFLKILTIQLANQDPSNPLDNKDFIAQMAQFSTLEQITNMSNSLDTMSKNLASNASALNQFASVIGKEISWVDSTTNTSGSGIVTGVGSKDGSNYYLVDGQKVPINQVNEIKTNNGGTSTNAATSTTTDTTTSTNTTEQNASTSTSATTA